MAKVLIEIADNDYESIKATGPIDTISSLGVGTRMAMIRSIKRGYFTS